MKDVVPRYFTMRGRRVPRRWGWDCHGLPVEYEVEKELGLSGRGDIVALGLARFTEACRSLVLRYADEWERDRHPARTLGRFRRCLQDDGPFVHGIGPVGVPPAARARPGVRGSQGRSLLHRAARRRFRTSRPGSMTPTGREPICPASSSSASPMIAAHHCWRGRPRRGRCRRTSRSRSIQTSTTWSSSPARSGCGSPRMPRLAFHS